MNVQSLVASVIALPDPLKAAIIGLVALGFSALLSQLVLLWPWAADLLGPYKDQFVLAVSGAIIAFVEAQLNLFPQYESVINAALAVVVALLGIFGLPFVLFKG